MVPPAQPPVAGRLPSTPVSPPFPCPRTRPAEPASQAQLVHAWDALSIDTALLTTATHSTPVVCRPRPPAPRGQQLNPVLAPGTGPAHHGKRWPRSRCLALRTTATALAERIGKRDPVCLSLDAHQRRAAAGCIAPSCSGASPCLCPERLPCSMPQHSTALSPRPAPVRHCPGSLSSCTAAANASNPI